MNSLNTISAIELTQQKELSDATFMSLLAIQKSITIEEAATAHTVTQVIADKGEGTVTKLVCAIIKLFNDGLNTTLQMSSRQLFECAQIWCEGFPHETVKDLILCLKRVKAGRYGPIYNRVDTTVITDFFRQYLAEKADWKEQYNRQQKSQRIKEGHELTDGMSGEQIKQIREFLQRAKVRHTPDFNTFPGEKQFASSLSDHLNEIAEEIDFEVLDNYKQQAIERGDKAITAVIEAHKANHKPTDGTH